jgi:hypothetical protein
MRRVNHGDARRADRGMSRRYSEARRVERSRILDEFVAMDNLLLARNSFTASPGAHSAALRIPATRIGAIVKGERAVTADTMIRGEPAIGRDQSREPRLYGAFFVKGASRHFGRPLWLAAR